MARFFRSLRPGDLDKLLRVDVLAAILPGRLTLTAQWLSGKKETMTAGSTDTKAVDRLLRRKRELEAGF